MSYNLASLFFLPYLETIASANKVLAFHWGEVLEVHLLLPSLTLSASHNTRHSRWHCTWGQCYPCLRMESFPRIPCDPQLW